MKNENFTATSSDERYASSEEVFKTIQEHARKMAKRKRHAMRWTSWLRDMTPQDVYPDHEHPRSRAQEATRHWLRAHTSWPFLSRFQTAFGTKLAASIPIAGVLIQSIPQLKGKVPMETFGWLFFAGLAWLTALLVYQCRCPRLLKATATTYAGLTGAPRRRLLMSYVLAELSRLASKRIWRPKPDAIRTSHDRARALELVANGMTPCYYGYQLEAQSLIESALFEWARLRHVQLLERGKHNALEIRWQRLYGYEPCDFPAVYYLHLDRVRDHEIKEYPEYKTSDVILTWLPAQLQVTETLEQLGHARIERWICEGVERLFDTDADAEAFSSIAAQWSNWTRPWTRLLISGLYLTTAALIGIFVVEQALIMIQAM